MNHKDMLNVYNQGPEAVIAVWTTLLNEIAYLRSRVEKLEAQVKKTPKTATNHLLPLQIEVTQHEAEVKMCPQCQTIHTVSFPDHVQHHVQYGKMN
jgi:hypothetical protein